MCSPGNRFPAPARRGWPGLLGAVLGLALVPACAGAGDDLRAGPYLSAKTAMERHQFAFAAEQFDSLIGGGSPASGDLLQDAVFAHVVSGSFDRAAGYARSAAGSGPGHLPVSAVLYAEAVRRGDWDGALQAVAASPPLIRAFLGAWAHFGAGDLAAARGALAGDAVDGGLPGSAAEHARYHLGLLDLAGGLEPEGLAALEETGFPPGLRSRTALARAAALGPAAGRAELLAVLPDASDPMVLRGALLDAGRGGFRTAGDAREGAAEAFLTLADLFAGDHTGRFVLFHRQLARQLRPEDPFACRAVKASLVHLGSYELADFSCGAGSRDVLDRIAELEMLEWAGDLDAARRAAGELREAAAGGPGAHYARGNFLRRQEDYAGARDAYELSLARILEARAEVERIEAREGWAELPDLERMAALEGLSRDGRRTYLLARADAGWAETRLWGLYFERGICSERLGDWERAEADFFRALEGSPGNPVVSNYLGYSWVDMGIHLERGLGMLVEAAAARPNDGNIADSVGWARYRLGDYEGALRDLERAVGLAPAVPEIYDHLGDALWRVERRTEARFQWRRALTLEVGEELRDSLLDKLEDGLGDRVQQ